MQSESLLLALIQEIALEHHLTLQSYADGWAFALTDVAAQKTRLIYGYHCALNSQSVAKFCDDKALLAEFLAAHNIPHVAHIHCFSPALSQYVPATGVMNFLLAFAKKCGDQVVLKPKNGTGGADVFFCRTAREVELAALKLWQKYDECVACPYEKIITEYRVICFDGEAKLIYAKTRPSVVGDGQSTIATLLSAKPEYLQFVPQNDCLNLNQVLAKDEVCPIILKHNLGCGVDALVDIKPEVRTVLTQLALRATSVLGARFVSVDIIEVAGNAENSSLYKILEINSGVMMEKIATLIPDGRQVAKAIYTEAIMSMFESGIG